MSRISVELVPRSEDGLREELQLIKDTIKGVEVINIPDLLRLDIRSWQGAAIAKSYYPAVIPHIRAIDVNLTEPLSMRPELRKNGITEVLVINSILLYLQMVFRNFIRKCLRLRFMQVLTSIVAVCARSFTVFRERFRQVQ